MDMSSQTDFNSAVNNLLKMNSTTSLVKTTAQEMIKDAKKYGTITKDSPDYDKEMDYNKDGEISISEKLRYYTEKTAKQITEKLQTPKKSLSELTKSDYDKAGMSGYYEAQMNLKFSKAITAYARLNQSSNYNNFTIKV